MNLNYDNVNLDNISPEVKQWYSFPEDKTTIKKFLSRELLISKEKAAEFTSRANRDTFIVATSLTAGTIGYCYLLVPNGKVIRDRMEAKMSVNRRWARRLIPFLGLAIPFCIVRNSVTFDNFYRD